MTSRVQKSLLLPWGRRDDPEESPRPQKGIAKRAIQVRAAPEKVLEFLVLAVPALWLGSLIFRYGVDSPFGDQWSGTFPLFAKMQADTLSLSDFFAFHNEHRIFFPKLLTFFLARLTHWNNRVELLVIWLLVCVCAFNIWQTAKLTGHRNTRAHLVLLLTASVLFFTPLQWENLLWGFQIGFLLPLACMTALPWIAFSRWPFNFVYTLLLCLVSTFSIASGMAAWLLAAGLLSLTNSKAESRFHLLCWSLWICTAFASVAFYFHGFDPPGGHPSGMEALRHPLLAIQFALTYLGFPFSSGTSLNETALATSVGGALVAFLGLALAYLWRVRTDRIFVQRSAPWLALIGIALINCFLTMFGRVGFGISAATRPRYVSFAILLPIGLLFLAAQIFGHWRVRQPLFNGLRKWTLFGSFAFSVALGLLFCFGTIRVLDSWPALQHERLSGKAVLFLINILDEPDACQRYLFRHPAVKDWALALNKLGFLRPSPLQSNRIANIARSAPDQLTGGFQMKRTSDGNVNMVGWAVLPWKNRVADSVLITSEDERGDPLIFARVDVMGSRDDVALKMREQSYRNCGWIKSLPPEEIPPGTWQMHAWALDAEDGHAFLIGGGPIYPESAVWLAR